MACLTVRFTKLLTNGSRSSLRTWQFHYVVVNQIVNLEMKLWILLANFPHNELQHFPTKFDVKFTTLFRSSQFDLQLRNEIAKFVVNFGNFKQTSETVCQKFWEMHCKNHWQYKLRKTTYVFSHFTWGYLNSCDKREVLWVMASRLQ